MALEKQSLASKRRYLSMLQLNPIGYYFGDELPKQGVPRQGLAAHSLEGEIRLQSGQNFEMALRDLQGFDRIWVIFQFHQNTNWRPTTKPPITLKNQERIGTFASRSPYRPNPIGLSCVKLISVQGLVLKIAETDLLDQTPILDIKPYIPSYDSHPNAKIGWLEQQDTDFWEIQFSDICEDQLQWLLKNNGPDLKQIAQVQLSHQPMNSKNKRVTWQLNIGVLAIQTWSLHLQANNELKTILVEKLSSRYKENELNLDAPDPYQDKELHRLFNIKTTL